MNEVRENNPQQPGWVKAAACDNGGTCIEVALSGNAILIRDSKDPDGPVLRFTVPEWLVFVCGVLVGDFDHLM
ncbi:DUF397 domain-containing protein [Nonomuraea sp. NPDC048826]|uniref:DUF397 domain-containing protein n=1 Tax=Nonomuraea sp. NPDC048826 TaxID=3364347 RepID=UPI0037120B5E